MSEKKSLSSQSLQDVETLQEREGYDDNDVFGHEEEHDVRISILPFQYFMLHLLIAAIHLPIFNSGAMD